MAMVVYAYIRRSERGIKFPRRPLFTNSKITKVARLNNKVVRRTKPYKTQRMVGLHCAVFKVMSYNL